jgi:peptidoglycan/LPS O-acetylase OafA/YrhL
MAVVLFHAGVPRVAGGFTGVDVFYVVSGYVVTGVLLRDSRGDHRAGALLRFWGRRARRLLPAAAIVLVSTVVASAALLPVLAARAALTDALWSAGFAANLRFARLRTDYLSGQAPSPLQHWWSLGVEEQFYLLWPLLVLGLAARRRSLMLCFAGAIAASLTGCVLMTRTDQPLAFFLLPFRAWELATGALVLVAPPPPRVLRPLFGAAGLAAVTAGIVLLASTTPYPGTAALLPVLGTAAVLLDGTRQGAAQLLDRRPLRFLGGVSYTWYLWHWPLLVLVPTRGLLGRLGLVGLALIFAILTSAAVERPVMRSARLASASPALLMGAAMMLLCVATTVSVARTLPGAVGHGAAVTLPPLQRPTAVRAGAVLPAVVLRDRAALSAALVPRPVPRNLIPSPATAHDDKAAVFVDGCNLSYLQTAPPPCVFGDPAAPRRVVLWGDSHAAQWEPALDDLGKRDHWRVESLTKATCPPLPLALRSPVLGRPFRECEEFNRDVLARIQREQPALVVLGIARHYSPPRQLSRDYRLAVYGAAWLHALQTRVVELIAAGSEVVVLGPTPKPPADEPTCVADHLPDATACAGSRPAEVDAAGMTAERAAVTAAGGHYVSVADWLCTAVRCPAVIGNLLVHRDDNHLSTYLVRWLEPLLAANLPIETVNGPTGLQPESTTTGATTSANPKADSPVMGFDPNQG